MAEQKEKKFKFSEFVTPVGIAKYCWVVNPDSGFDGKGDPKFKLRLLIDDTTEAREWVERVISKGVEEAKAAGIKLKKVFKNPFQFPEDQDEDDYVPQDGKDKPKLDEDHQGRIFFEIKSGFKPGLIDSAREELPEDIKIMSGDKVRVKFVLNPYEGLGSGISLRLKVVQLIEKNTSYSGGGRPNTDGFDDIDGYRAGGGGDSTEDDNEDGTKF